MPYKMEVRGEEELLRKMEKVPEKAREIAAQALYEGAGIVADAVSRSVHGIETKPFIKAQGGFQRVASPEEKAILESAPHGVSRFKKTPDDVNTSIGFQNSGYATLGGKTVPVPLIANAINSGTSFRKKQPFIRQAFTQSKAAAVAAIEAGLKSREAELDAGD